MTPPQEPNQLNLDYQLGRHYGDQLEIEHSHEWLGLPGKIRLLGWRARAVLASYRDAISDGLARNVVPDIAVVRHQGEKNKYGVGINLEQALSRHAGLFLRAMRADGRTETLAFTEADESAALGVAVEGAAWGRPQDGLGVALLANGISRDRRDYLAAGGLSFFIGDGRLNYRPETIFETYYSWQLGARRHRAAYLSLGYQRVYNPAYNADRGPVDITAFRFHADF
jgi:hypothetical protein